MPHAFSTTQLVLRVLFLLVDVGVNAYILSNQQPFIMGTNYGQSIVFFNAAMIMIIYIIDLMVTGVRRSRTIYEVGEGITDLYRHEH
jgi:hypothetical protein